LRLLGLHLIISDTFIHIPLTIIANAIPIEGWTSDPSDEALLDLLPVLDSLRFTSDVRRVLGLRKMGAHFFVDDIKVES
jgi:hypothetical protein